MGAGLFINPPAGALTKLANVSLAAPATTLDSGTFTSGYKYIYFYVSMPSAFSAVPTDVYTYFNHTAGGKYNYVQLRIQHASVGATRGAAANNIPCLQWDSGTAGTMGVFGAVSNYAAADKKFFMVNYVGDEIADANWRTCEVSGCFNETAAEITRIEVVASTNFPTGSSIMVFGAK